MTEVRLFTREEAERTLPLVRRIVEDVREEYRLWREALDEYDIEAGGVRAEWGEPPELIQVRQEVADRADRINACIEELAAIGCVVKGLASGIVDFYALREDRLIFLCWHLGEERITHWHEVDAGFSGRQPIDAEPVTSTAEPDL